MAKHKQWALSLAIGGAAGFAVTLIAFVAVWRNVVQTTNTSPPPFRMYINVCVSQSHTQWTLEDLAQAIPAYQQRTNALPATLDDLRTLEDSDRFGFEGTPGLLDGWRRPFKYVTDGTTYTVTSLGRDGRPGGVGLDCDLTLVTPRPPSAAVTFSQFLFDCPTGEAVGACVAAGLVVFAVNLYLTQPTQLARRKMRDVCVQVIVTVVISIVFAFILGVVYVSSGH